MKAFQKLCNQATADGHKNKERKLTQEKALTLFKTISSLFQASGRKRALRANLG